MVLNAYTLHAQLQLDSLGLSNMVSDSIAKCREQVRNMLSECLVPSKALEKISAKELLGRTEARVVEVMSQVKDMCEMVSLIKPDAAPVLSRGMQSIEKKLGSYIEILKQDTINPAENTKLGLEQLRQTIAEVSEFVSRAEEFSMTPDPTISLVLDAIERGGGGLSGRIESLGGELQRVTGERDYIKKRLEEVDYVVSSLRSEKASLEEAISQTVSQLQMAEEEAKKWKREALQTSFKSLEESLSQLNAQLESLRSENERLKLMVRLERARYFKVSQQSKGQT